MNFNFFLVMLKMPITKITPSKIILVYSSKIKMFVFRIAEKANHN